MSTRRPPRPPSDRSDRRGGRPDAPGKSAFGDARKYSGTDKPRSGQRRNDDNRSNNSAAARSFSEKPGAGRFSSPRGERTTSPRGDARRADGPASSRSAGSERGPTSPARKAAPRKARAPIARDVDDEMERIGEPQRIAKLLARAGVGSRRDIERMIEEGRIALNGELIQQPAPLLASLDGLTVDGTPVAKPVSTRLYRFYKPNGCLTAARDPKGRKTIYDMLPAGLPRLMPVGRLDFNTEGLLLLTNDGEFKRQLELPSSGIERTYRARAFGDISQSQLEELAMGIEIDGIRYGKIDANLERRTGRNQWIEMTLTEGKNREVRNVLEHLGLQVSRLIRVRYGEFSINGLETGDVDMVPRDALFQFRRHLG